MRIALELGEFPFSKEREAFPDSWERHLQS